MKMPSPKRIAIFDIAVRDLVECTDLPADLRARLIALRTEVNALANPTGANPADHLPVYGQARDGSQHVVICSCGSAPKTRASRGSMDMAHYNFHLNATGLPRNDENPHYTEGRFAGMTFVERYTIERAEETAAV